MLFLPARKEKLWNWGLIPRWFWYKKVANLNPPPKKLKKPMQKKSSFRKKNWHLYFSHVFAWLIPSHWHPPALEDSPFSWTPTCSSCSGRAEKDRRKARDVAVCTRPGRCFSALPATAPLLMMSWALVRASSSWLGWEMGWFGGMFQGYFGDFWGYGWWVVCWFFGDMVDEWCVVHGQSFDVGMVKKGVYRGCRRDRDYKDGDEHGETEKDSPKSWPILILKKQVHSSPSFIVSSRFVLPCHQKAPHPRPCLCCHPLSATSGAHRRRQPSYYRWPWDPWHISHPRPFQSSSRPNPLGVEARFGGLGSEHLGNRNATHWKPKSNHSEWNAHKLACTILDPRKWVLLAGAISAQTHA